jgi:hypothetical protein
MQLHCLLAGLLEAALVLLSGLILLYLDTTVLNLLLRLLFLKICVYFCSQVLSRNCCVLSCLLSSTAVYYISGRFFSGYNAPYLMSRFLFFTMQNAVLFVVWTTWLIVLVWITGGRFSHGECVLLWNERCWFFRIRLGVMWY